MLIKLYPNDVYYINPELVHGVYVHHFHDGIKANYRVFIDLGGANVDYYIRCKSEEHALEVLNDVQLKINEACMKHVG